MCGQALGYETLALGLFVKLKSNVVRVHGLLSGFRQPCIWSMWASNHLEQKPYLTRKQERGWEAAYRNIVRNALEYVGILFVLYILYLSEYVCVCVCVCACARAWVRACEQQCEVGCREILPGREWLSYCELKHVAITWQRVRDSKRNERERGKRVMEVMCVCARSCACVCVCVRVVWLPALVWCNLSHTFLWGPSKLQF